MSLVEEPPSGLEMASDLEARGDLAVLLPRGVRDDLCPSDDDVFAREGFIDRCHHREGSQCDSENSVAQLWHALGGYAITAAVAARARHPRAGSLARWHALRAALTTLGP